MYFYFCLTAIIFANSCKTKVHYELFIPRLQSFIFNNRMDLHEDKEKNILTPSFEFPGSKKENIQLKIQNGRLTVLAENIFLYYYTKYRNST